VINPTTKTMTLSLASVATQILAAPAPFRFDLWPSQNLTQAQALAKYGLGATEYRYLFIPDVIPTGRFSAGIGNTLTTSTATQIANRINKFVANVAAEF
jgi:hypothetical protein